MISNAGVCFEAAVDHGIKRQLLDSAVIIYACTRLER